mmetsp:Transcript_9244/g.14205  ORF Transcript_9244/g.14205 Transcript_9244/m.14205 type:complete len:586 (-) Transcript_9244:1033-2790(-)
MVQKEHIRPKKRTVVLPCKTATGALTSTNKESSSDDLDALLNQTRAKMNAWLGPSGVSTVNRNSNSTKQTAETSSTTTLKSEESYHIEKSAKPILSYPAKQNPASRSLTASTMKASTTQPLSKTLEPTSQPLQKSILRKPKYSSSSAATPKEIQQQRTIATKETEDVELVNASKEMNRKKIKDSNTAGGEGDSDNENNHEGMQAILKDLVVERDVSIHKWNSAPPVPQKPTNAMSVEGYTPQTESSTTASAMDMSEKQASNNEEEGEPFVLSSMSALLAHAKKCPSDSKTTGEEEIIEEGQEDSRFAPNSIIEAKLSFSCMSKEEYEETKRQQQETSSQHEEEDILDKNNDLSPEDEAQYFMGQTDIFGKRTSSSTSGYESEDDDEPDAIDFLHSEEEGEEEDDDDYYNAEDMSSISSERRAPRAFMEIWNALTQWITPQAVELLQNYQGRTTNSLDTTIDWTPQVDRSDIGASRCAGLMSILKMHRAKGFRELMVDGTNHRMAETRLADLLRTMDFSQPTPKLNTNLWRAMTVIFLRMVLYRKDGNSPMTIDDNTVPDSIKIVGMTKEEYLYLTQSSLTSLGSM